MEDLRFFKDGRMRPRHRSALSEIEAQRIEINRQRWQEIVTRPKVPEALWDDTESLLSEGLLAQDELADAASES